MVGNKSSFAWLAVVALCVCALAGLAEGSRLHVPTLSEKDFCPLCLEELPKVLKDLEDNATQHEIEAVLFKACEIVSGSLRQKCEDGVKALVTALGMGVQPLTQRYSTYATCSILGLCEVDCCEHPVLPEQVHISITNVPSEMRVTWVTLTNPTGVNVQVSQSPFGATSEPFEQAEQAACSTDTYTNGGWTGFIHTCLMTGLAPKTRYFYRVGSSKAVSQTMLQFTTRDPAAKQLNVAVLADMGATDVSDPTIMQLLLERPELDLVVHNGDSSYADLDQTLWDSFFRKIEPIAGYVPYMTCAGNHESLENFAAYSHRFLNPNNSSDLYYSFDYGMVHFLAINTEASDDLIADLSPNTAQYAFVEKDLAAAAAKSTWIIVFAHRPFYCSNHHSIDCMGNADTFRQHMEPLFKKYGVDLVITGHKHNYERTARVYQQTLDNDAPVYLVNGCAGNKEHLMNSFQDPQPEWSKVRFGKYGAARMNITEDSLQFTFVQDETNMVLDHFEIEPRKKV